MFIACRRTPTSVIARFISLALSACLGAVLIAGCSRQQPEPQQDWSLGSNDIVKASTTAGGVPTHYEAHFDGSQLQRIVERRTVGAREDAGAYTFKGARLMEYSGATINGRTQVRLTFDLQGALTGGQSSATGEEVAEITNRSQLLRSLALTRRTSQGHGG